MNKRMVISISLVLLAVIVVAGIASAAPSLSSGGCTTGKFGSFKNFNVKNSAMYGISNCKGQNPAPKVDVCHQTRNGTYIKINISEHAVEAHLMNHQDGFPNDYMPGKQNWAFDENCVPYELMSETLFVESYKAPSDPTPPVETSSFNTKPGKTYQLIATGSYRFAEWGEAGIADTKYSFRPPNQPYSHHPNNENTWVDGADLPLPDKYTLQVVFYKGSFGHPLSPVGWVESFNEAHVYTATVVGDGNPLEFFIHDSLYVDNIGGITVSINELP